MSETLRLRLPLQIHKADRQTGVNDARLRPLITVAARPGCASGGNCRLQARKKEVSLTQCPESNSTERHCHGVILHHRAEWWLVEFPERDPEPIKAWALTGQLTPAMADWFCADTGNDAAKAEVAALNPDSRCWSGEFSIRPSPDSADRFDIEAHPWGSEAGELEMRLARAMIESTLFPIPPGFLSVFTGLPDDDRPVLAIRLSGYICSTFELLTARYMPVYRPRSPWRDISGEAVGDSGSDILGWAPARDWIRPA